MPLREQRSRLRLTVCTSHKQGGKSCWPGNATRDMFALLRSGSAAELGAVPSQCSFVTAAACLIVFNERRSTENRVKEIACLGASVKHVSLRVKEDPWTGSWPLGRHRMRIKQQQFSGSGGDVNDIVVSLSSCLLSLAARTGRCDRVSLIKHRSVSIIII